MPNAKIFSTGVTIVPSLLLSAYATPVVEENDYIYNGFNFGSNKRCKL